jgi:hypothetical protein
MSLNAVNMQMQMEPQRIPTSLSCKKAEDAKIPAMERQHILIPNEGLRTRAAPASVSSAISPPCSSD